MAYEEGFKEGEEVVQEGEQKAPEAEEVIVPKPVEVEEVESTEVEQDAD